MRHIALFIIVVGVLVAFGDTHQHSYAVNKEKHIDLTSPEGFNPHQLLSKYSHASPKEQAEIRHQMRMIFRLAREIQNRQETADNESVNTDDTEEKSADIQIRIRPTYYDEKNYSDLYEPAYFEPPAEEIFTPFFID